jgi:arginine/lysine/ornithine decarboxylase
MLKVPAAGFSVLPAPVLSPVEAYERLVKGEIESLMPADMAGRTVATGVVDGRYQILCVKK